MSLWGMLQIVVASWLNTCALKVLSHICISINHRITIYLQSSWSFIAVCIVLRFIEGIGAAFFSTAGSVMAFQLFPDSIGFIVV